MRHFSFISMFASLALLVLAAPIQREQVGASLVPLIGMPVYKTNWAPWLEKHPAASRPDVATASPCSRVHPTSSWDLTTRTFRTFKKIELKVSLTPPFMQEIREGDLLSHTECLLLLHKKRYCLSRYIYSPQIYCSADVFKGLYFWCEVYSATVYHLYSATKLVFLDSFMPIINPVSSKLWKSYSCMPYFAAVFLTSWNQLKTNVGSSHRALW